MTRVLVPLAAGVEEMEAVIIIDVFRRAGWTVDAVGLTPGIVEASRGVRLQPDATWDEVDPGGYDVMALPGGNLGTQNLMTDERVLTALRHHHEAGRLVAAVCAAPLVLQKAGIIHNRRVTCHPAAAEKLTSGRRIDEAVVTDGNLITSQGPGTTFAFALAVIVHQEGAGKAEELARGMVLPPEGTP